VQPRSAPRQIAAPDQPETPDGRVKHGHVATLPLVDPYVISARKRPFHLFVLVFGDFTVGKASVKNLARSFPRTAVAMAASHPPRTPK
jgi:hypothetical protein